MSLPVTTKLQEQANFKVINVPFLFLLQQNYGAKRGSAMSNWVKVNHLVTQDKGF